MCSTESKGGWSDDRGDATHFPPFLPINPKWSSDEWSITNRGTHGPNALFYRRTPYGPNNSSTQSEKKEIHFQLAVLLSTTGHLAQFIKEKDNMYKLEINFGQGTKIKYIPDIPKMT